MTPTRVTRIGVIFLLIVLAASEAGMLGVDDHHMGVAVLTGGPGGAVLAHERHRDAGRHAAEGVLGGVELEPTLFGVRSFDV